MHQSSTLAEVFPRLKPMQKAALKRIGLETIRDLLFYFPARYGTIANTKPIADLKTGDIATIIGTVSKLKTSKGFRTKIPMAHALIEDHTGKIKAVWFNQPYIAPMLADTSLAKFYGRVAERKGELYLSNPEFQKANGMPIDIGDSLFKENIIGGYHYPVYPETRGITSKWLYHAIQKIFDAGVLQKLEDPIPAHILKRYSLPSLKTALIWIHTPQKKEHAESARKRFAFEEIFFIQLERTRARSMASHQPAYVIHTSEDDIVHFVESFPFPATEAQHRAIGDIFSDLTKGSPMARLLEGDVGSGKTAVAAASAYAIVTTPPDNAPSARLEIAYMAPTEILAKQHFETFIEFFRGTNIQIGLITGSICRKFPSKTDPNQSTQISKSQLLKWVANGEIPIVVGTHALIQKSVQFKNLALVIIDEQHRFGTRQRFTLTQKGTGNTPTPHLLSMTATPIPRTLALTIYGDLDLSLLDEMPHGRKAVHTEIVLPSRRKNTYEKIRAEIKSGRQCYVICPRINEPDPEKERALQAKSVTEEATRLKRNIFPEFKIDILHGKMSPKEKDVIMGQFSRNDINILVATSVVEVGVNIPNATNIIIEGADRFGLSQLHQLRGRVARSTYDTYCYVFTDSKSETTFERLKALATAKNGFELAELDLHLRGAGELAGGKQWGISDIGMDAIKNPKLVEAARNEAKTLIEKDPKLTAYPLLANRVERISTLHLE